MKKESPTVLLGKLLPKAKRARIPQLRDIAAEFINSMGGTQSFAAQMVTEWQNSPPGSMQRTRIADLIFKGLRQFDGEDKELSTLDTAEVERIVLEKLEELAGGPAGEATPG